MYINPSQGDTSINERERERQRKGDSGEREAMRNFSVLLIDATV